MNDTYDCIVLGGGPAGSTAAALIAERGYSTLLLEREKMPRFHVGESLMPETYWTLRRLGLLDRMKNSQFVQKCSVQFVTASGKESAPFFFDEHDPRECSQTWQVERAEFDKMLFDNAADKGADCHDQIRAIGVCFDDQPVSPDNQPMCSDEQRRASDYQPRATGVIVQVAGGRRRKIAARVVIDGTGQQSLIAHQLGLRQPIAELRKAAIWAYFRGASRPLGKHAGGTVILHTQDKRAWFWFIPLSDDITSVGLVSDVDNLLLNRGAPADRFNEQLGRCPPLLKRLENSHRSGSFHVAKEFSYTTRQHAGNGWVLVGDAFGFLDPIYSSGVFFALKTGELAADAVVEGLERNDLSGAQLGEWTDDFSEGAKWIRKLIDAYYNDAFSFGQFMKRHPEHRGNLTDLLIGRIFHDGAGRIFDDLQV